MAEQGTAGNGVDRTLSDGIDEAALERVMQEVPRGALALAGIAVFLLMVGWFGLYLLVFLPRGSVG